MKRSHFFKKRHNQMLKNLINFRKFNETFSFFKTKDYE